MSLIGSFLFNEVVLNQLGRPVISEVPLLPDETTIPFAMSSLSLERNAYELKIRAERRSLRIPAERRSPRVRR
jgi:hypothetical protein